MTNSPLMELLTEQLRDLYDAEKQLMKALPRLAKAAGDEELAQGFREHAEQTQQQAHRLEQVFEAMGMKARGKTCEAMKGLIQEGQEAVSGELEESMRDIALVAAARRVEHYEMAAYDSLISAMQAAKQSEAVALLQETLKEETATDKTLTTVGKRLLKEAARPAPAHAGESHARPRAHAQAGHATGGRSNGGQGEHVSKTTTDHEEIRHWAEQRGGKPACVQGTGGKSDIGLLRIEFPGKPNAQDNKLSEISWDDFFDKFDERGLAMVYQEHTADGKTSNFNKLVSREESGKPKARAAR